MPTRQRSVAALFITAPLVWLIVILIEPHQRAQILSGLGTGSIVAAIGLGIVLTFRGSGVVNFAAGAMSMFSAYMYYLLRTEGRLLLPPLPNPLAPIEGIGHLAGARSLKLPHWPTGISLNGGRPIPTPVAVVVTVILSSIIAAAIYLLVFRPLRNASPLAKVVASVGILLVLQSVAAIRFGTSPTQVPPVLPQKLMTIWGMTGYESYYWITAIVLVAAGAFAWIYRATRFGLATRAISQNQRGALVLGFSPDRTGVLNWMLTGAFAALIGVLVAPVIGLDSSSFPLLVVPALAAALLGGFTSFITTALAAMWLGVMESVVTYYTTTSWFPKNGANPFPGASDLLVLVVIIVALLLRGRSLPTRGDVAQIRLPAAPMSRHSSRSTLAVGVIAFAAIMVLGADWRLAVINSAIACVIALSFVIITGLTGQISLAQMAFAGVSGFVMAKFATSLGIGFPLGPIIGVVTATALGTLVALPALRIRGVNLAVLTLAAGAFIENCVFQLAVGGGAENAALVPPPSFLGIPLGFLHHNSYRPLLDSRAGLAPNPTFGVLCILVAVLIALAVANTRKTGVGRRLLAIRANERATASLGVSVLRGKVLGFAISAAIAGIAGVLSAYRFGSVDPTYFSSLSSLTFLVFAYLGGVTTVLGAGLAGLMASGGLAQVFENNVLHLSDAYGPLVGALGVLLIAIRNPEGLAGYLSGIRRPRQPRKAESRDPSAFPAAMAPEPERSVR